MARRLTGLRHERTESILDTLLYCMAVTRQHRPVRWFASLSETIKPRPHQQQCRSNRQLVRSNIRHCRKNRSTCSIRQCCFDVVAGVDFTHSRTTHRFSAVYAVIVCTSVCLSLRPSVKSRSRSRSSTKVVKPKITQTTPYDNPGTLLCGCQIYRKKFQRGHPN